MYIYIHGNKLKILIHQHLASWSIAIWWKSKLGLSSRKKPAAVKKKQNSWFIIMFPMRNGHRLVPSENPENRLVVDGYHPLSTGVVLLNLMLSLELNYS